MKKEKFAHFFNLLDINEKKLTDLSNEVGFIRRIRKVRCLDFLYSLSMESIKGIASCNDIAAALEVDGNVSVSRQAIWKKLTDSCMGYVKRVLELVILNKIYYPTKILNCRFNRVLIQDSTIINCLINFFLYSQVYQMGLLRYAMQEYKSFTIYYRANSFHFLSIHTAKMTWMQPQTWKLRITILF